MHLLSLFRGRLTKLALVAAITTGCSVLLGDLDYQTCTTDADCAARGPAFAGSICGADGVCASRGLVPEGGSEIDGEVPFIPCSTNAECREKLAVPAICNRLDLATAHCAPLENAECKLFNEPAAQLYESEEAVVLAMVERLNLEQTIERFRAAALAFHEINSYNVGFPAIAEGGRKRPIVFLGCSYTKASAQGTVEHLSNLGVTGLIGVGSSDGLIDLANYTIAKKMFTIGTTAASPALNNDDQGLLWRVAPSAMFQGEILKKMVVEAEGRVRDELSLPDAPAGKVKVAVLSVETIFGQGVRNALENNLIFNGGTSTITTTGEYLLRTVPDDVDENGNQKFPSAAYNEAVDAIVAFRPNIIVAVGVSTDFFGYNIVDRIEKGLRDASATMPQWLLNEFAARGPNPISWVTRNPGARPRIRGIYSRDVYKGYDGFVSRYKTSWPSENPLVLDLSYVYDAAYVLAYGYYAGNPSKAWVTGPEIAEGAIKLIPRGSVTSFETGPGADSKQISNVFTALRSGSIINLEGVTNSLDFDPIYGELSLAATNLQVFCFGHCEGPSTIPACTTTDDGGMGPILFRESGQRYDATTDTLVGTFDCP